MATVGRRRADWSDLRLLWAVAETGSFGAAARALRVSQSTITRRIDELEYRLNAKLFVRRPQGVTLTRAGKLAYDRVVTMERSAEALENLIMDADDLPQGEVGIAAPDGVAGVLITPYVADFLRANPQINLTFDCGLWPDRPTENDVDISLTFSEPRNSDVVAQPLAHFHYALFAAQSYLDLYGRPSSLGEGATHPYIHHAAQVHQPETWHPKAEAFRTISEKRLVTNSSAVSLNSVVHGVGIGLLPTAALSAEPSLVMLDELPHMGCLRMWLCHHRDIGRSARIRKVVDWLGEVFDPKTKPWYREEFVHPRDFMHLIPGAKAAPEEAAPAAPAPLRRARAAG